MPYSNVKDARDSISALKNKSTEQVKKFIKVFNGLVEDGKSEKSAIRIALGAISDTKKSVTMSQEMKLSKELYLDKSDRLRTAVMDKYSRKDLDGCIICWAYLIDFDDEYVYVGMQDDEYKIPYEDGEVEVEFTGEPIKVKMKRTVEFMEVDKQLEQQADETQSALLKTMNKILSHFGGSQHGKEEGLVLKQFDEEEMVAIEPLYAAPDHADEDGEAMRREDIEYLVESGNKAILEKRMKSKYSHKDETQDFSFLKLWVSECDCFIGEHFIPEGQPIAKVKFHDKDAWEKRKAGELMGLSIGARCKEYEEVN